MNQHSENPASNVLPGGVKQTDLDYAITKSGYPLQSVVASWLRRDFTLDNTLDWTVEEEWGYVDVDSGENRNMDIHATVGLFEIEYDGGQKTLEGNEFYSDVLPYLDLLIECKQSELPYVFFLTTRPSFHHFPLINGLAADSVCGDSEQAVFNDAGEFSHLETIPSMMPVIEALGLKEHPFLYQMNDASTFSRCEGSDKKLKLSGADPYNGIVLPLLKSANYLHERAIPLDTATYYNCSVVICLGVLNAPMVGVRVTDGNSHDLIMLPWVRVWRHQHDNKKENENRKPQRRKTITAVDIVHKDFFETYMKTHLLPFAKEFSKRVFHKRATLTGFRELQELDSESDSEPDREPRW